MAIPAAIVWMAVFFVPAAGLAAPVQTDQPLYNQLANLNLQLREETGEVRTITVIKRYRKLTAGMHPCTDPIGDDAHADDLFRATAFTEIYSLAESDVNTLSCLYAQLAQRGKATAWHTHSYAQALVSIARYADANALLAKMDGAPPDMLPEISIPPGQASGDWRFLSLQDATHARVQTLALPKDRLRIVAVVHPACHFSARALDEIEAREDLRWLRARLFLIVPPNGSLPREDLLEWNTAHPDLPMQVMFLRKDWRTLPSLDTPTFYLMRGRTVVLTFEGWPNLDGVKRMQAAITGR